MENLKLIPGFPNYMISSDGKLWSKERKVLSRWGNYRLKKGKWIKPDLMNSGYHRFTLWNGKQSKRYLAHRLVLMVWNRLPECKEECDHINGNKLDNRIENLRWVTCQQNCEYASAKKYKMIYPDGSESIFINLAKWCNDNKLRPDRIHETTTGRRNHYKGYKLIKL